MIRLTWLQYRSQAVLALGALLVTAIVLAVTGTRLSHLYDTTVASCQPPADCGPAVGTFMDTYRQLQHLLGLLVVAIPLVAGLFFGAPLISRELENGTFRLAWTQSVSRSHWLAAKLGVIGLASVVGTGLVSLMVTWWFRPLDTVNLNRFDPVVFDERGIMTFGFAAFAFALGVTAGLLTRRMLAAMAITLVLFIGVRWAVASWVRPHYIAPAHRHVALNLSRVGFRYSTVGGTVSDLMLFGFTPPIPNAWVYSTKIVDDEGRAITSSVLRDLCLDQPLVVASQSDTEIINTRLRQCLPKIAETYHQVTTYQPADRYWLFQGIETALYLGLAVILAGFCFWWVRYRVA